MKINRFISAMDYIDENFITESNEYKRRTKMIDFRNKKLTDSDTVSDAGKENWYTLFTGSFSKRVIATVATLALIVGTCFAGMPADDSSFGIIVVSAAGIEQPVYSVSDETTVELPVKALLRVGDIRGLDAGEKTDFQNKFTEDMVKYLGFDSDKTGMHSYGYRCHPTETAVVYYGYMNDFVLDGIDTDKLSEISISLDGMGVLEINNESFGEDSNMYEKQFVITADEYKNVYANRNENATGMHVNWMYGKEISDMFSLDPETPVSVINDTITFTVRYMDGSTESFDVNISFNDNGEMKAVYNK